MRCPIQGNLKPGTSLNALAGILRYSTATSCRVTPPNCPTTPTGGGQRPIREACIPSPNRFALGCVPLPLGGAGALNARAGRPHTRKSERLQNVPHPPSRSEWSGDRGFGILDLGLWISDFGLQSPCSNGDHLLDRAVTSTPVATRHQPSAIRYTTITSSTTVNSPARVVSTRPAHVAHSR